MKLNVRHLIAAIIMIIIFLSACKKNETIPEEPIPSIRMKVDSVILENINYTGTTLSVVLENFPDGTLKTLEWSVENPRIAQVSSLGLVMPKGAGITYVFAKLPNGKGESKCKIIVTDENDYKFRLVLTDKGKSDFSIDNPEAYLSAKAIERRRKRNIPIDETDLPISRQYLKAIAEIGGTIVAQSKWLNTVSVNVQDQFLIDKCPSSKRLSWYT